MNTGDFGKNGEEFRKMTMPKYLDENHDFREEGIQQKKCQKWKRKKVGLQRQKIATGSPRLIYKKWTLVTKSTSISRTCFFLRRPSSGAEINKNQD